MHIVIEQRGRAKEVAVDVDDARACVADLLVAAGVAPGSTGIAVDGRPHDADQGLDEVGLYEGARVVVLDEGRAPRPDALPTPPVLAVIAGPAAGGLHHIGGEPTIAGRAAGVAIPLDDPAVSEHHAAFELDADGVVFVTDLDSHNGTWIDDQPVTSPTSVPVGATVRLGATLVAVRTELPNDRPFGIDPSLAAGSLVPFNRMPRSTPVTVPARLEAPPALGKPTRSRGFSIVMLVGPLAMGGAMVAITGEPRFAMFIVLSPLMLIGNSVAQKRWNKKERKQSHRELRAAVEQLRTDLATATVDEVVGRRIVLPDAAETARRARLPSTSVWERRPHHGDFLRLRGGIGTVSWEPPVDMPREGTTPEVSALLAESSTLPACPVEIDLSAGGIVGLVGERTAALAMARSLVVQAAVHHGPADVGVVVLAGERAASEWDWAKWLPHALDGGGARLLAGDRPTAELVLDALLSAARPDDDRRGGADPQRGRTTLLVLDDIGLTEGRRAPARLVLRGQAGPVAGIVIAEHDDRLPASCTTIVHLRSDLGDAALRRVADGATVDSFLIDGLSDRTARAIARTLARYEDPELAIAGAGLPSLVRLLPLLGLDPPTTDGILAAWGQSQPDPPPTTPLGIGEAGALHLDLVRDGPHGLIGGTTGSGKSELLRSMVAGMASRSDPDHLVFVLVDYKGGSAFDLCAELPHTVGMVTDLDEHLGERALRSLEAELRHRERVLRDAGTQDLPAYLHAGSPAGPLPRLAVIIDEFATLATELPDFLGALVGIAQRGRSLGVHLILATQRPSGAVNANIKANTNLRIALRVQDAGDSSDIIDRGDAATIARSHPGRAYVRLGPTDVELVQTPLSTAAATAARTGVRTAPFRFGPGAGGPARNENGLGLGGEAAPSDLRRLVDTITDATAAKGIARPRRPWLEMLDEHVTLDDVRAAGAAAPGVIPFAIADDPDRQQRVAVGWKPADGHLAVFGMVGSGTTTTLLGLVRAAAEQLSPDQLQVYGIDFGAGGLRPLAALPHTGAVLGANDREGHFRLVRHLRGELDRRRQLDSQAVAAEPTILVAIDGIGAFLAEHESVESAEVADTFRRLFTEGTGVGLLFAVSSDRVGALPLRFASAINQKILMRLADPGEFTAVGLRPKQIPAMVPGRGVHSDGNMVVQIADPGDLATVGAALTERHPTSRRPLAIRALPGEVTAAEAEAETSIGPGPVKIPVGLADADLSVAMLSLHGGEHALIAGPPRSGKSTALAAIAQRLAAVEGAITVAICDERSPLYELEGLDAFGTIDFLADVLRAGAIDDRPWFVLIDDAPSVPDHEGVLTALLQGARRDLHVIASGRADDVRTGYSHWSKPIRAARTGLLLQPDLSMDGDLFNVRLPRRLAVALVPGRGFLVSNGDAELVQVALPTPTNQG
ncbi:MAG: FtsK/SpoIIIE domain-containing protein [Acidimicrobiales bacterium]